MASKALSNAGDDTYYSTNLSARDKVNENRKTQMYVSALKKLTEAQSEFMEKFESLKGLNQNKFKDEYRYVALVRNNDCKLVVKDEDLLRFPKKIRKH